MSALAFDHVTLRLGGRTILADVSLDIGEGEFIGLLGANGAGKTTLIKAALGLIAPAAGTVRVLGAPPGRNQRAVGYLPQTRSAPAAMNLTGRALLASAAAGHRWGLPLLSSENQRDIEASLDLVDGRRLAERPLASLSGGERQRLLIAQALLGRPRLLLLDEPLISLDPTQQHVVVDLVRRLAKELGLTVIFSAHELNQLIGAMDRVLYLGQGTAALGSVDEVITPATLSRLYSAPIEVVRAGGRIFVLSGNLDVERDHHLHDDHHGHSHGGHRHHHHDNGGHDHAGL